MQMNNVIKGLVVGGLMAFAAPVLACPGAAETTASIEEKKDVQLTGVVTQEGCPVDAAEMGCTGYVLTADNGGEKYMIQKTDAAEKLLSKVKAKSRVKVTGDVAAKGAQATLKVTKFKVGGNA
jgi:hypothetical protein